MFRKRRNIQKEKTDVKTYGFTYVKEHNQVKQDQATVKTTTETGVRTADYLTQTFNTTGEVVGNAFNWVVEHLKEVVIGVVVTTAFFFGGEFVTVRGT